MSTTEALPFDGTIESGHRIAVWADETGHVVSYHGSNEAAAGRLAVATPKGTVFATAGDWVIRDKRGLSVRAGKPTDEKASKQ